MLIPPDYSGVLKLVTISNDNYFLQKVTITVMHTF